MIEDRYGRTSKSIDYGMGKFTPCEWDDTTTEGTIYLRARNTNPTLIKKITATETGGTITYAVGAWADRASLEYKSANTDDLVG